MKMLEEIKFNDIDCPVCGSSNNKKINAYLGTKFPFNKNNSVLIECNYCKLIYINPFPLQTELDDFYIHYWNQEYSVQCSGQESIIAYKAQALSRFNFLKMQGINLDNKSILDFGAGHGFFEETLRINNVKNYKYSAIETDVEMIKNFKEKGIRVYKNLLDITEEKFDILVAFHILEHILDPIKVINDLINNIKPGGILFIEIPNRDNCWKNNYEPHILFFNQNSIKSIFEKLNLKNYKIQSCGRLLEKLLKEKSTFKKIRRHIVQILKKLGLRKIKKVNNQNRITEELARKNNEMDIYGNERQWLRIIVIND